MWVQMPEEASGVRLPRRWSYRWVWAAWYECSGPNCFSLQELYDPLTTEPSFHSLGSNFNFLPSQKTCQILNNCFQMYGCLPCNRLPSFLFFFLSFFFSLDFVLSFMFSALFVEMSNAEQFWHVQFVAKYEITPFSFVDRHVHKCSEVLGRASRRDLGEGPAQRVKMRKSWSSTCSHCEC